MVVEVVVVTVVVVVAGVVVVGVVVEASAPMVYENVFFSICITTRSTVAAADTGLQKSNVPTMNTRHSIFRATGGLV